MKNIPLSDIYCPKNPQITLLFRIMRISIFFLFFSFPSPCVNFLIKIIQIKLFSLFTILIFSSFRLYLPPLLFVFSLFIYTSILPYISYLSTPFNINFQSFQGVLRSLWNVNKSIFLWAVWWIQYWLWHN